MPAIYTHDRFGKYVFEKLGGEVKSVIEKHYSSFQIGLQGPDPLLYHRPYLPDEITKLGDDLHKETCAKFLKKAIPIVRKAGIDSGEYAYLMGFLCHFTLDSECHPYVDAYSEKNDVAHVFMESELDKYLMKEEKINPHTIDLSICVPQDHESAHSLSAFYPEVSESKAKMILKEMYMERKILYTPTSFKYNALLTLFNTNASFTGFKNMMFLKEDDVRCVESNLYLSKKVKESIDLAVELIYLCDDCIQNGTRIAKRFYRDFETLKQYDQE